MGSLSVTSDAGPATPKPYLMYVVNNIVFSLKELERFMRRRDYLLILKHTPARILQFSMISKLFSSWGLKLWPHNIKKLLYFIEYFVI